MIDVPPFLAHLERDRRGLPVPWINAWGSLDDREHWRLDHDPAVGGPGLFFVDHGDEPNFKAQNPGRQRLSMARGLCQVCGRSVPWSNRWLVVADTSVEFVDHDGRRVGVITEPWLDARCAAYALRICPALIRRTRHEQLGLLPVTDPGQVAMLVSHGWVDGPLEEVSKRVRPAMFAKVRLLGELADRLVAP